MRRSLKGKTAFFILLALAGGAYAYISASYKVPAFITSFSAGGGASGGGLQMKGAAGEAVAGSAAGENYTLSGGFFSSFYSLAPEEEEIYRLKDSYLYPNPFRPGSGGPYDADKITFANLPDIEDIRIYNLAGELVNTLRGEPAGGELRWEPVNRRGRRLASGVYIYYITSGEGKTKTGKFSVIH